MCLKKQTCSRATFRLRVFVFPPLGTWTLTAANFLLGYAGVKIGAWQLKRLRIPALPPKTTARSRRAGQPHTCFRRLLMIAADTLTTA